MSMVSIAPNVLEKMADDANVRAAVLRDVDIYVKNYKQYNIPGVVTMSFSIDAGGVPCIHGENEILKVMCDEGEG